MATQYITADGDRLDMIAYQIYKTPEGYQTLIAANPNCPVVVRLPAGIVLEAPDAG